jgi:hypothetical protein
MRILIDTQIFIWAVIDSENLSAQARRIMLGATEVFVSSASIWEIAIKARLGKLEGNPNEFAVSDQAYDVSGPSQDFRSCRLSVCPNSGRSSCLFISRRNATRRDSQISGSPGLYHQKQYEGLQIILIIFVSVLALSL